MRAPAMLLFVLAVAFTLGVSFICSMAEACMLSTKVADLEALKKLNPKAGELWERHVAELEDTISTILTLNTIANSLGSMAVGFIAARLFGDAAVGVIAGGMTVAILIFSEVLPKNIGIAYRSSLQPILAHPLWWARRALKPVTYLCNAIVRLFIPVRPEPTDADEEIKMLAERGAKEGRLGRSESRIIANALSLDDVRVAQIMTPRSVVTALNKALTVGEVFKQYPNLPFGRMPVYEKKLDTVVGIVRRRDLLKAKANDQDSVLVAGLMLEVQFIPETVTLGDALQLFLRSHQKLAVVVDEYGSVSGVVTLEDVFEHLIGREIFEKDDMAVDMRELARARTLKGPRALPGRKAGDNRPA